MLNGSTYRQYFSSTTASAPTVDGTHDGSYGYGYGYDYGHHGYGYNNCSNGTASSRSFDPIFGLSLYNGFGLLDVDVQFITMTDIFWFVAPMLLRFVTLLMGLDFFTRQITARHILERLFLGFQGAFLLYTPPEKRTGVRSHPQFERNGDVLPLYKKQFNLHTASRS